MVNGQKGSRNNDAECIQIRHTIGPNGESDIDKPTPLVKKIHLFDRRYQVNFNRSEVGGISVQCAAGYTTEASVVKWRKIVSLRSFVRPIILTPAKIVYSMAQFFSLVVEAPGIC